MKEVLLVTKVLMNYKIPDFCITGTFTKFTEEASFLFNVLESLLNKKVVSISSKIK